MQLRTKVCDGFDGVGVEVFAGTAKEELVISPEAESELNFLQLLKGINTKKIRASKIAVLFFRANDFILMENPPISILDIRLIKTKK